MNGIKCSKVPSESLYFLTDLFKQKYIFWKLPETLQDSVREALKSHRFDYPLTGYMLQEKIGFYFYSNSHFYLKEKLRKDDDRLILKWAESDIWKIIDLCHSKKIRVVLLNYPLSYNFFIYEKRLNSAIRSIATEYSIPFVDIEKSFDMLGDNKKYFFQEGEPGKHPNEKGYKLIAFEVLEVILKNNLIPQK